MQATLFDECDECGSLISLQEPTWTTQRDGVVLTLCERCYRDGLSG